MTWIFPFWLKCKLGDFRSSINLLIQWNYYYIYTYNTKQDKFQVNLNVYCLLTLCELSFLCRFYPVAIILYIVGIMKEIGYHNFILLAISFYFINEWKSKIQKGSTIIKVSSWFLQKKKNLKRRNILFLKTFSWEGKHYI